MSIILSPYQLFSEDPYINNVVLHLKGGGVNGGNVFTDISPTNKTITTFGNTRFSNAQNYLGSTTIYFDGSIDYLSVPISSDFNNLKGDFTIEARVYLINYPTAYVGNYAAAIVSNYAFTNPAHDNGWIFRINGTASTPTAIYVYTGRTVLNFSISTTFNTWNHIAVTRNNNVIRAYFNGVQSGSSINCADDFIKTVSNALLIGGLQDATYPFWLNGYIERVRITKGIARYTSNFNPLTDTFLS